MSGELRQTDYESLRERRESDQSQLSTFSGDRPTAIAVVRKPRNTGIDEVCDEWWPELGMPERHLDRYWAYREGFRTNSAVENAALRAWNESNLRYHYERYLRRSAEAQAAIGKLCDRLESGENITLVCFEEEPDPCHRHILIEIVTARMESDYSFGERVATA